jgi:mannosyltransferase
MNAATGERRSARIELRRRGRRYAIAATVIVVVALALRLFHLGAQSFWADEISVASFVRSGHLFTALRDRGGPFEPPLHYLGVLAALQLPIGFETAARIPAAIYGTLEVLGLILLTREATGRRVPALVAGALLAVAPFAVRYGQENRYYTTFSALALLTWWLWLRAVRTRTRASWIVYGLVAALLLLAHPFAPLVLGIQGIAMIVIAWRSSQPTWSRLSGYVVGAALAIVLVLPWYVWGATRWIPDLRAGKSYSLNPPAQADVQLEPDLFKRTAEWLLGNSPRITPLVVLLVLAAVLAPLITFGRTRRVAISVMAYTLGVFLVLVPLATAMGTYFAFRRIESLLPPLLLLAALTLVGVGDRIAGRPATDGTRRRVALAVSGGAVVLVVAVSMVATVKYYRSEKSDYRALARVVGGAPPDALVVIGPVDTRWVPWIKNYLDWKGVDRPVRFLVAGKPAPKLPFNGALVVWLTGSPPADPDLATSPLNDIHRMQIIAGDRSVRQAILPWFASTSEPASRSELDAQRDSVFTLPPFMDAP